MVEVIRIRSAAGDIGPSLPELLRLIAPEIAGADLHSAHILVSPTTRSDLMLVLAWKHSISELKGSELAFLLKQKLRTYGMIDYSLWHLHSDLQNIDTVFPDCGNRNDAKRTQKTQTTMINETGHAR